MANKVMLKTKEVEQAGGLVRFIVGLVQPLSRCRVERHYAAPKFRYSHTCKNAYSYEGKDLRLVLFQTTV